MPDPLAFFLTWTTYGTWLPGDQRGWVRRGKGLQLPDPVLTTAAKRRMREDPCTLDIEQRRLVEQTITDHCNIRGWQLHAVNCRTSHVHVVVSADRDPEDIGDQLKAWCTRKLKQLQESRNAAKHTEARSATQGREPRAAIRQNWWTERGSLRYIGDEESLEAAIQYVLEGQ